VNVLPGSNLDLMARRLIAACNMDIASCLSSKLIQVDLPRDWRLCGYQRRTSISFWRIWFITR